MINFEERTSQGLLHLSPRTFRLVASMKHEICRFHYLAFPCQTSPFSENFHGGNFTAFVLFKRSWFHEHFNQPSTRLDHSWIFRIKRLWILEANFFFLNATSEKSRWEMKIIWVSVPFCLRLFMILFLSSLQAHDTKRWNHRDCATWAFVLLIKILE